MVNFSHKMTKGESDSLIERYIQIVRNVFLKEGGWRYATSLYLIGGFARDEGTYDLNNGRLHIYNDLDFLVVVPRKDPLRMLALRRIMHRLNDGRFGCQIDLIVATDQELRDPDPLILNFDIQHAHTSLWGEKIIESGLLRTLKPNEISRADALQLLLNRQASLMIGLSMLRKANPNLPYLQVQLSKPLLAMMAAVQVMEGTYRVPVSDQLEWIEAHLNEKPADPLWQPFHDNPFFRLLCESVKFKQSPRPEHFAPYDKSAALIAQSYFRFLKTFLAQHYNLPTDSSINDLIVAMRSHQPRHWDLFSIAWWRCRLHAGYGGIVTLPPGHRPHPQVDVYGSHLLWMSQLVEDHKQDWRSMLQWYRQVEPCDELEILIGAWRVSSYGCRLR